MLRLVSHNGESTPFNPASHEHYPFNQAIALHN
jgi:hypothetical protein